MEIKSWRELSRQRPRRKKSKLFTNSQVIQPMEMGKKIEQLFHDVNEKKIQTQTLSQSSHYTNSTNKYNMSSKNLHKNKKSTSPRLLGGWFWWLIGLLLVTSVILLISAFRFAGSPVGSGDVEINISGPIEVGVGEEATWVINYKNISKVDFSKVQINVRYPDGLKLKSTEPAASNLLNTGWVFDNLARGQSGEIKIYGQLYGDESQLKDFFVELIYQPVNFSSDFVKNFTYQVILGSSQVQLGYSLPESTLTDVEQEMSFKIKNVSDNELSQIIVKLETSKNFFMINPSPEIAEIIDLPDGKSYVWPGRTFVKNQEINFIFKGKFLSTAKGIESFKIKIISINGDNEKILCEEEKRIVILGEEIALSMRINNNDKFNEVRPGEVLQYDIDIHNTSGLDLENLNVYLQVNYEFIDWSSLKTPVQPRVNIDGTIIFTPENYSTLKKVSKGEKITIPISFNLKNDISSIEKFKTYTRVSVGQVGNEERQDLSFSTPVFSAEVVSPIKLRSNVLYRDDEGVPVGEGFIPPQVGKKTEFQVVFSARASQIFSDLIFSANLPPAVTWEGEQNEGKGILSYNPTSRLVTWQVGSISPDNNEVFSSFILSITPQTTDIGKVLSLLSATNITYNTSGQTNQVSLPALDTNLAGALYDANKGIVVE